MESCVRDYFFLWIRSVCGKWLILTWSETRKRVPHITLLTLHSTFQSFADVLQNSKENVYSIKQHHVASSSSFTKHYTLLCWNMQTDAASRINQDASQNLLSHKAVVCCRLQDIWYLKLWLSYKDASVIECHSQTGDPLRLVVPWNTQPISELLLLTEEKVVVFLFSEASARELRYHSN